MKICSRCNIPKSLDSYSKNKANKDGKDNRCKECHSEIGKALVKQGYYRRKYAKNREKILARKYHLNPKKKERMSIYRQMNPRKSKQYKIRELNILTKLGSKFTIEDYDTEIQKCRNTCMICGKDAIANARALTIDHDHTTGIYRGILCMSCNMAIGLVNDNPEILRKMIDYLEKSRNGG